MGNVTLDPFYDINSAFGIDSSAAGLNLIVRNGVIGWDVATSASAFPLAQDSHNVTITFDNMDLCPYGSVGGVTFLQCSGLSTGKLILLHYYEAPGGSYIPNSSRVFLRNSSLLNIATGYYPTIGGQEGFYSPYEFVVQDCAACSPVTHGAWVAGGFLSYDATVTHTSGYSERITPRILTFSGYISSGSGSTTPGTTLTVTSGSLSIPPVDFLFSNGSGFVAGTAVTAGSGTSYTVSQTQSVGSSASPVQFQSYYPDAGALRRVKSAPYTYGIKVAVKSGNTATVCVWIRPSVSTDSAPPWGGSAVTYNADAPRMLVRTNPYMGVQSDTVLATDSSYVAGTWTQLCGTTPSAPADGEFEIIIDADQTFTSNAGGSINVSEWSASGGAINPNGGQEFWFNGTPFDTVTPASGGSGGFMILR